MRSNQLSYASISEQDVLYHKFRESQPIFLNTGDIISGSGRKYRTNVLIRPRGDGNKATKDLGEYELHVFNDQIFIPYREADSVFEEKEGKNAVPAENTDK